LIRQARHFSATGYSVGGRFVSASLYRLKGASDVFWAMHDVSNP
jgi:hypothetical protein